MNSTKQRSARSYSMENRAGAAAQTTQAILDTTVELYWQLPIDEITLAMVAAKSGVSVQTVIRKFGNRDELFAAAAAHANEAIEDQRNTARPGDLEGTVRVLVDHYEEYGDGVIKLLSEEHLLPAIADAIERGRALHYDWCERVFAPELAAAKGARRRRLLAQLIVLCDVYAWKLLRRDRGLSRKETETAIVEMIAALKGAQS